MAITYIDYIDKIKLSEDEVYEIADTKARSQIVNQENSILSALTNSSYASLLADNALLQLSIIEDVAGTLDWITNHGAFVVTDDEEVKQEVIYFIFNQETGDYDPIVYPDPTKNPHEEGWYILDITDSQTKFIMAHLAVTTRGLWVLPSRLTTTNKTIDKDIDNSGKDTKAERQANANARQSKNYKILLSNDGLYIYDGSGREVVKYGSSIEFSGERPFWIGNDNTYIAYYDSDKDGVVDAIRIQGNTTIGGSVTIGESSKTLTQLLDELDGKISQSDLDDLVSVSPTSSGAIININGSTVQISNGTSGGTYYTWIRYSADPNGANMQVEPDSTTIYMGIYVGPSSTAPTEASSYRWSRYRGQDGIGISGTSIQYGVSNSASSQPSSWQDAAPSTIAKGSWLWTKTITTYTNGSTSATYGKSYIGTDGNDGSSVYVNGSTYNSESHTTTIELITMDSEGQSTPSTFSIKDGTDGTNGAPGAAGYVHFAWANSADGTEDFSTSESEGKSYLGVYTDNIQEDSEDPEDYSWSLIRGADGLNGTGISTVSIEYGASTSSITQPSTWYPDLSSVTLSQGDWFWTRNSTSYTDSTSSITYTKSYVGTDGKSVNITKSDKVDGVVTITLIDQNGNQSTFSIADGADGEDGTPGAPGADGTSEYIHFAWAYDIQTDSTTDPPTINATSFSKSDSQGKRYLGVYSDSSTTDSDEPNDYSWSLIKGADGTPGRSITNVEEWYGSSTSSNVLPSSYNISIITPSSVDKYVWNYEKIIYNNDTSNYSTTAPHIVATFSQDGAPGQSLVSVTQYYFASNSTVEPSGQFTTSVLVPTSSSKYIWNYEELLWNNWEGSSGSTYATTTDKHIIAVYGDKGDSLSAVTNYYGSSTISTVAPVNYSTDAITPSLEHKYIWNYEVLHWDNDLVSPTTTEPHIIAVFSEDGDNGQSLLSVTEKYGSSNSTAVQPSSYYTTVITPSSVNKYIWNYEQLLWDNWQNTGSTHMESTTPHIVAMFSNGVTGTTVSYYISTSGTTTDGGSWSTEAPSLTSADAGKWLWVRTETSYDEGPNDESYTKTYIGKDGKDGTVVTISTASQTMQDGHKKTTITFVTTNATGGSSTKTVSIEDGKDGDKGQPGDNAYVHWAWANSEDGLVDFSVDNTIAKKYIGVYADENEDDSLDPSDYTWTLIKGEDGADGQDGSPGARGTVIVYPQQINWEEGDALLAAVLIIDGIEVKQGLSYQWSKTTDGGTEEIQNATESTYSIQNDDIDAFNAIYNCTIIWSEYSITGYAVAGISRTPSYNVFRSNYALIDHAIIDQTKIDPDIFTYNALSQSGLLSIQTGSFDLRSFYNINEVAQQKVRRYIQTVNYTDPEDPSHELPGVFFHPEETPSAWDDSEARGVLVRDNIDIIRNGQSVAEYGENIRLGEEVGNQLNISTAGVTVISNGKSVAQYGETITLGEKDGFHISIGQDEENNIVEMGFYQGAKKVAYINEQRLYIPRSVVLNQMDVGESPAGQWSWKVHTVNGSTRNNLYLKWLG